jgi:hypothetical protein
MLVLFTSCQDPSALDADREIKVIFDPNNLPPEFMTDPALIDFGIVHPGKTYNKDFLIKNITDKNVEVKNISMKKFNAYYSFISGVPFILTPKGTSNFSRNVMLSFMSDSCGNFSDVIDWVDYKNPVTEIKAKVASVWADDIKFETTKIGSFDLKFLKFHNSSNVTATITEFEIIETDGVIINEPAFTPPVDIAPKSTTDDIILTFYPTGEAKEFKAQIKIKVKYSSDDEHFTDEEVLLEGRGIF